MFGFFKKQYYVQRTVKAADVPLEFMERAKAIEIEAKRAGSDIDILDLDSYDILDLGSVLQDK